MTHLCFSKYGFVGIARSQFWRLHGGTAETVKTHLPVSEMTVGEVFYGGRTEGEEEKERIASDVSVCGSLASHPGSWRGAWVRG